MTDQDIINDVSKLIAEETLQDTDPTKYQDAKNEDDEFKRIAEEQFRRKELEKVRNLTRWP